MILRYDELMRICWLRSPGKRPSIEEITGSLERLIHGIPNGDEYYGDTPRDLPDQELYSDIDI